MNGPERAERLSNMVAARFAERDRRLLERAAEVERVTVSEFLRHAVRSAARERIVAAAIGEDDR